APKKTFLAELLRPLQQIEHIRQTKPGHLGWNGRWPSTVTQFVVGGVDETDLELLSAAEYLHKKLKLSRVYYSRFNPVRDTPLENRAGENPWRVHRLYQASFLFRDYNFDLEEMPFDQTGSLPLDTDPKLAWAYANLRENPVEVNRASREELLRVPGIGPRGADLIVSARRRGTLRAERDLQQIGVQTRRLKPYVLLDGQRPTYQLPLFDKP
ncbi:MAG: helix-hairpin-helix domain-containing protein, partial [Anaerolineales bacterium]|nr:helix-hairpin-helix domain-containing protein [Anaerolineales bacterium]